MQTETRENVLLVQGLDRLTADNVALFRELIRATLEDRHVLVEVDMSGVRTMDSEGVGALIAVYKGIRERGGSVRLTRPTAFIGQLLRLLRLDQVLDVVS